MKIGVPERENGVLLKEARGNPGKPTGHTMSFGSRGSGVQIPLPRNPVLHPQSMTILLSSSNPVQRAGNGSAVHFPFPWKISAATDLIVGFITASGYARQTSGYSISASSLGNNAGGAIIFSTAPPVGTTVDIRTQTPLTQATEFADL